MTQAPVLALLDFSLPFTLETDASGIVMGAVLMQWGHPLAYFSKLFYPRLQHASTYIRELHAITTAVRKWRQYLLGHPFIILTDHKSLHELMNQVIQTPEQQVYLSKHLGYDYSIQYKSGKTNVVADALSRLPHYSQRQYLILSMPHPMFLEAIRDYVHSNTSFQDHIQQLTSLLDSQIDYRFHDGLLYFQNRICLDQHHPFRHSLISEFHTSPLGGRMGFAKTLHRLQASFH